MQLLSALHWRYAARRFTQARLPDQVIHSLVEATRLSASSYGLQPYRLIQVDSLALRAQLLPHAMGQQKVLECSHLLVLATETNAGDATVDRYMALRGRLHDLTPEAQSGMADHIKTVLSGMTATERQAWAREQAFIALGTLLTAAALQNIDSCPITGFEAAGFDRVLGLPEQGLTATALCVLGHRHPDDDQADLPKVRLAPREFVQVV